MAIARRAAKRPTTRSKRGFTVASKSKIDITPRILSSDEKRELILAHADARNPLDPTQRFTLWAGVSLCIVFVIGAWMYTVGASISDSFAKPLDPALQEVVDNGKQIGEEFQKTTKEVSGMDQKLKEVSDKLSAMIEQEAVIENMASQLNASSTDSIRENLFQAQAATGTQ
jgi:hypothetical protein